jgi:hypothetical protein
MRVQLKLKQHIRWTGHSGQSIVQVLVASAIMGIILAAMVSMQVNQNRETRALTEKLSALDLQRTLTEWLSNTSTCNMIFAASNLVNSGSMTFDATAVSPQSPHVIPLFQIPNTGAGPAVATAGATASFLTNTLRLLPANGLSSGVQIAVNGATTALLQINFDPAGLVRPIHSLQLPITLATAGPASATQITGCSGKPTSSFLVNKGATDQVIPPSNWTLLTWQATVFDATNSFANNRFTPKIPGKYLFILSAYCVGAGANDQCSVAIEKNGIWIARGEPGKRGLGSDIIAAASIVTDMNGASDYVEGWVYDISGDSISAGPTGTYFNGTWISP